MKNWKGTFAASVLAVSTLLPVAATAAPMQKTKEWENLAIAGGLVTLLGLLKHDGTVTFIGAAGGLYSLYRYEQDRKSTDRRARARAAVFSKGSFTRNGVRYTRRTVRKNGRTYYQFVRAR